MVTAQEGRAHPSDSGPRALAGVTIREGFVHAGYWLPLQNSSCRSVLGSENLHVGHGIYLLSPALYSKNTSVPSVCHKILKPDAARNTKYSTIFVCQKTRMWAPRWLSRLSA